MRAYLLLRKSACLFLKACICICLSVSEVSDPRTYLAEVSLQTRAKGRGEGKGRMWGNWARLLRGGEKGGGGWYAVQRQTSMVRRLPQRALVAFSRRQLDKIVQAAAFFRRRFLRRGRGSEEGPREGVIFAGAAE